MRPGRLRAPACCRWAISIVNNSMLSNLNVTRGTEEGSWPSLTLIDTGGVRVCGNENLLTMNGFPCLVEHLRGPLLVCDNPSLTYFENILTVRGAGCDAAEPRTRARSSPHRNRPHGPWLRRRCKASSPS